MLSTKLEGLGVLRRGNGAVRPNKGRSGMLSEGPNATRLDNGKKKVGLGLVTLTRASVAGQKGYDVSQIVYVVRKLCGCTLSLISDMY